MANLTWSIQHKRDTAANFTANNPILLAGQLGIETDGLTTTPKFKIGDGTNTWNALPYFYGGSASAQNLNNVLTVGNTTTGKNIVLTDDDIIQVGSTANRKIGFNTSTIVGGLELVNLNSNDHIILQDAGGIHIDTTYIQVPQVTASRILATDASNKITGTYTTTGSGTELALSTSPTFITDITTPLIIGGTAVGSGISYKGTSGNGTSTVSAHTFTVGNNGATTAAQIFNSGQVNIGNYASPTNLRLVTIGQDTAYMSFGSLVGATSQWAIYGNQGTPSVSNYSLRGDGNDTVLHSPNGSAYIGVSGGTQYRYSVNNIVFTPTAAGASAITNFTFNAGANTGQTASTEISNFKVNGASKTWAAGAITTQRWNYFTANTAAFASASTITTSYGLYVEAATAGSNATITNNYALGGNGSFLFSDGTRSLQYTLAATALLTNTGDTAAKVSVVSGTRSIVMENFAADVNYLSATGTTFRIRTTDVSAISLQTNSTSRITIGAAGGVTFADANNISFNATTGTKIGTATTEKLAFWNATPIVQPTTAYAAATFVAGAGTAVNDASTFDGYTLKQIVAALRGMGLLA